MKDKYLKNLINENLKRYRYLGEDRSNVPEKLIEALSNYNYNEAFSMIEPFNDPALFNWVLKECL